MTKIKRKHTKIINVGKILIGGDSPISVQSMTTTRTDNIPRSISQILKLEKAGCDLVRVAIPNLSSALAIQQIKKEVSIPIIADIHFNYKLAIESIKYGADCIRINPGNIHNKKQIERLVSIAGDYKIPIRIGINSGSLEKKIIQKYKGPTFDAMVESAMKHINFIQNLKFNNIKISVKSSDVYKTIMAYRLLSSRTDLPLHLGITEAGPGYTGIVKSSIGIGTLLNEGIGDTIRVSLTKDPVEEVKVGFEILNALSIRKKGPEIISCPTCGRCEVNLFHIVSQVEKITKKISKPIKIAIMGCIVNGPGEAKDADIGIASSKKKSILFKKGKIIRTIHKKQVLKVLLNEIKKNNYI